MKIICSFCKQEKEHYAKGLCRACYKRKQRKGFLEYYIHPETSWYERNKKEILKKEKEYYLNNQEKIKKHWQKYYLENKEKESLRKKQWYLKNRERILKKHQDKKIKKENKNG